MCADHVRFHPCLSYMEHLLIMIVKMYVICSLMVFIGNNTE